MYTWYQRWVGYTVGWAAKQMGVDPFLPWWAEGASEIGIGFLVGNPRTGPHMKRAAGRTGQVVIQRAIQPAAARIAIASGTVALYGAALGAGYAIGATVGTGMGHLMYGDAGAQSAIDLYSGKVSVDEYLDVVGAALGSI